MTFAAALDKAFLAEFGYPCETEWNIFDMRYITYRSDGKNLTKANSLFIGAYSTGWLDSKVEA